MRDVPKQNINPEEGPKVDFSLANVNNESRKSTITARKAPAKKSGVSKYILSSCRGKSN